MNHTKKRIKGWGSMFYELPDERNERLSWFFDVFKPRLFNLIVIGCVFYLVLCLIYV